MVCLSLLSRSAHISVNVLSVKGNANICGAALWYGVCDGMTGKRRCRCQPDDRPDGPTQDDEQEWNVKK
jgi:hypothetical protein